MSWGGHSIFCVLCFLFLCVWPGMVPNQRQLAIVVSDWEPYSGSLFSLYGLWVVIFCLVFLLHLTELLVCRFVVFVKYSSLLKWLWIRATLQVGPLLLLPTTIVTQSIITLRHEGQSIWKISRTFKVSSSAVSKTIKCYDDTGSHEDRHRNGRHSYLCCRG